MSSERVLKSKANVIFFEMVPTFKATFQILNVDVMKYFSLSTHLPNAIFSVHSVFTRYINLETEHLCY